ncbi:NUDIX domain-containing protein [Phaeobacter sp. 11ANDIMAR09]|uniref:NUDIX domain-containing protein n=1 Tax=Phaeobacter sp. 11ANDIMAR09 TaxID=1225647 RepID=UPI0006C84BF1|nr:NUDIX domain-containing protein [Phaeobacter sp. 11ANDIMAR09]KPD12372.1 tellurium resistance protein [Phaeobacter sp. 11ANDIMAR09]
MVDLFFYGTLRYVPLLELVLGRSGAGLDCAIATLADHAIYGVQDQIFPMIAQAEGETATGLLVRGLSKADLAALDYYEGGFDYALEPITVRLSEGESAAAQVYFPAPGQWQAGGLWDLEAWIAAAGALTLRAAEEVMSYQGRVSAEDMRKSFPSIRRRAAAWLTAQSRSEDPAHDLARDVAIKAHKRAYVNFFAMEEMDLSFRRYDGSMSPVVNRGVALVGRASVVLPYDPQRDEVLLVEQFRAATFIAGEKRPWMWEPVAGLIDPGESPEQAARREAMEEAGVTISRLEEVSQGYPYSGSSGEFIYIFVGVADLGDIRGGGGVAGENEDLRSEILSFDALMQGIDEHRYQDMPLITAALWLARHRERLRSQLR